MMQEARGCLKGAFALCLFSGNGILSFDGSWGQAWRSFWPGIIVTPLFVWYVILNPDDSLKGYPDWQIGMNVILNSVISPVLWYALMWFFAGQLKARDRFPLFVAAGNWTGTAMLVVFFPAMAAMVWGWAGEEQLERVMILLQVYAYAVVGCVAYKSFPVPWQMAGFVAVSSVFVNETTRDILYLIQGIASIPV